MSYRYSNGSTNIQITGMDAKNTVMKNSSLADVVLTLSDRTDDVWRSKFENIWSTTFSMVKKPVTVGLHGLTIHDTVLESWEEDHLKLLQDTVAKTNAEVAAWNSEQERLAAAAEAEKREGRRRIEEAAAKFNAKQGG